MKKVVRTIVPLLLVVVLLLAGCTPKADTAAGTADTGVAATQDGDAAAGEGGATITIMGPPSSFPEPFMKIMTDWETKTGNKMEVISLPEETYGDVMATKIATNQLSDICIVYPQLSYLAATNPAKNFVDLTGNAILDDIADGVMSDAQFMVDGKVYAYPQGGIQAFGVFYNKNLLADNGIEVPATYEDFIAACDTLKANGITPMFEAGQDAWPTQCMVSSLWGYSTKEDPSLIQKLNSNEVTLAGTPSVLQGQELYADMQANGYMQENVLSGTYEQMSQSLAEGTAGFVFCISMLYTDFLNDYPDQADEIGFFVLPHPDYDYLMPVGSILQAMSVNKNSPNVDAAMDFLEYYATPEVLSEYFGAIGQTAPFKTLDYQTPLTFEEYNATIEQNGIELALLNALDPGLGDEYMKAVQELLSGTVTPEEVLTKMDELRAVLGKDVGKEGW